MQDQLRQGIIEAVPAGETPPRATHYLPHHAIVCRDKYTTKVRVVYDGISSLTSSLHTTVLTTYHCMEEHETLTDIHCNDSILITLVLHNFARSVLCT